MVTTPPGGVAIVSRVYRSFPQSLQENARIFLKYASIGSFPVLSVSSNVIALSHYFDDN